MGFNTTKTIFQSLMAKPKATSHFELLKSAAGWRLTEKQKRRRARKKKQKKFKSKHPKVWKYKEYIKSQAWRKRRNEYFREYGKKCAICHGGGNIGLHHISYQNLGKEEDKDLVALCWSHHEKYHELHNTKVNMQEETFNFIIEEQQDYELSQIAKNL